MDKEARREAVEPSVALLNVSIICFGRGIGEGFFFKKNKNKKNPATVETFERGKWL